MLVLAKGSWRLLGKVEVGGVTAGSWRRTDNSWPSIFGGQMLTTDQVERASNLALKDKEKKDTTLSIMDSPICAVS